MLKDQGLKAMGALCLPGDELGEKATAHSTLRQQCVQALGATRICLSLLFINVLSSRRREFLREKGCLFSAMLMGDKSRGVLTAPATVQDSGYWLAPASVAF